MVGLHACLLTCNTMRPCLRTISFTFGGAPLVLEDVWKSHQRKQDMRTPDLPMKWQNWGAFTLFMMCMKACWCWLALPKLGSDQKHDLNGFVKDVAKGRAGSTPQKRPDSTYNDLAVPHLLTSVVFCKSVFRYPVHPHLLNLMLTNKDPNPKNERMHAPTAW